MWVGRLFAFFLLVAALSGLGSANAHAGSTFPSAPATVPIPSHIAVANALGAELAADPSVTTPPDQVSCWVPEQTKHWFNYQCDAMHKFSTMHWRTVVDNMYGLHVKLYEDGTFVFKRKLIAKWTSITRKF